MKTVAVLLLAACSPLAAYELHEWGTFTTVAGSDGVLLTGLQREEEPLPAYVHSHPGFNNHHHPALFGPTGKKMPVPVRNVTVKMETPVIYFHSKEGFDARVKVGFEGGTICQWYPQRSGGEVVRIRPPKAQVGPYFLDFAKPYRGLIEWEIQVLSPEESAAQIAFKPDDLLQWTRSRIPEANWIRTGQDEAEGFLFYRGLGAFEPGLTTTVSSDETLSITNHSGGAIPYLLVYEKQTDGSMRWMESRDLGSSASLTVAETDFREGAARFDPELYRALTGSLAALGLLDSEAEAMVQTWWKSYFDQPGLRVFWVLPAEKVDAILPLEVEPAPENTVRVIVGRSEVIRPRQEKDWLARAAATGEDEALAWKQFLAHHRFGLAYGQRVRTLEAERDSSAKAAH